MLYHLFKRTQYQTVVFISEVNPRPDSPYTHSVHCVTDVDEAIRRAILKRYGKKAVWEEDTSLRTEGGSVRYGQVFKPTRRNGEMAAVSDGVRVEFE